MKYDNKINCYYLLYKLKDSPTLWIVKISEYYDDLKDIIRYINSKHEKYYIVLRKSYKEILNKKFKQFNIFKPNKTDTIIFETN